jgi:hypothetical protein
MRDVIASVALFIRDALSIRISHNRISRARGDSMSRGNVGAMTNSNMQAAGRQSVTDLCALEADATFRHVMCIPYVLAGRAPFPTHVYEHRTATFLINGTRLEINLKHCKDRGLRISNRRYRPSSGRLPLPAHVNYRAAAIASFLINGTRFEFQSTRCKHMHLQIPNQRYRPSRGICK